MTRYLSLIFLCSLFVTVASAQNNPRYLVLFKDKTGSPYSISKPTEFVSERSVLRRTRQNIPFTTNDLPVNPAYNAAITQTGAKLIYSSRWFNGSLVEASADQLEQIKKLPFYRGIELNLPVANLTSASPGIFRTEAVQDKLGTYEDLDYGRMNSQLALMEASQLHDKGFQGQNMLIAVLDNGFLNGNNVSFLKSMYDEKRLVDSHDFVARDGNVYNDGSHGLHVLSTIAAYVPSTMIGAAFKAAFALYRTENDLEESPYEEVTWLLAAERADSLGADIINSSLGYRTFAREFNTPAYNYTRAQMDGKTTIISRAARYATRTGMLVVNAAGNEGSAGLSAPADVDSVLTVGGTALDLSPYTNTSVGPNAINQMKPDVAAVGQGAVIGNTAGNVATSNGTSFASPLIAGLSAILWQAYPRLTAQQLIYVLKKSGHQAANPNNILGYGVPRISVAEHIIQEEFQPLGTEKDILSNLTLSPNPTEGVLFLTVPESLVGKKASLKIYQVNGSLISQQETRLSAKTSIATSSLNSGLYILKTSVDSRERTLKFIKK
ncbi:S8 family peptidase [Dyadobacter sp. CY312]|uniref:S8 family peptidase n=1 Tax=Dyadobacter sp. CY312 TaxID=2907303 RepID=UPI001F37C296|nr:S8 family peptidase [Dyadobacter sp. CY312]MCE7039850.1 S8 family peptidase [Dyadobacter sp. CY312]